MKDVGLCLRMCTKSPHPPKMFLLSQNSTREFIQKITKKTHSDVIAQRSQHQNSQSPKAIPKPCSKSDCAQFILRLFRHGKKHVQSLHTDTSKT